MAGGAPCLNEPLFSNASGIEADAGADRVAAFMSAPKALDTTLSSPNLKASYEF
jgi:hypothetical protein